MLLGEVLADVQLSDADAATPISGVTYDSRRVQPGFLFAAWHGLKADGHAFIADAVERGAKAILCERAQEPSGVPCVVVPDVRGTLARAAQRFYADPAAGMTMVGVTGTNGKTTTVHLLEALFSAASQRVGIIGTLGARFDGRDEPGTLTTPESVDLVALLAKMRDARTQAVAMEVSSQALAQQRLAGVAFDVGVFTNLTHDHLDYHGSLDNYFAAKEKLFSQCLKHQGVAVLNADDPWSQKINITAERTLLYSAKSDAKAGVRARAIDMSATGLALEVDTPRGLLSCRSPLVGRFNIENILAAIAVGEAAGLPHAHIAQGIASLTHVPGRLERVSDADEPLVLVDYAHTPDALDKALAAVREVTRGRLFCVFGCGGDRDPKKRAPMGQAALKGSDWAVVTNDNPRSEAPEAIAHAIEEGLRQAGGAPSEAPGQHHYWIELDRSRAIHEAVRNAQPGDAVLIAGKGHETYQIIGSTRHEFDDRRHARHALDARKA